MTELLQAAKRKQAIIVKQKPNNEFYASEEFLNMLVDDLGQNVLTSQYYQLNYFLSQEENDAR